LFHISEPLEDLGIDGKILLKWSLNKQDVTVWTRFIRIRIMKSGVLL
jgi:hypothetical protein